MSLPITWPSVSPPEVSRTNLLSTSIAPFTRLVDPALSTNEGNAYTNLQDAWDACSDGDSIFVKAGLQSGGLVVSSGSGNLKHNIRVVCESGPWAQLSPTDAAYWTSPWLITGVYGLQVERATIRGASGTGMQLSGLQHSRFDGCVVAGGVAADGWLVTSCAYCTFVDCGAYDNDSEGWVLYDGVRQCEFSRCWANINGSHSWYLSQFPSTSTACEWNVFTGCWARDSSGSGDGWFITVGNSGTANGWGFCTWQGCFARGCAGDGWSVDFDSVTPNNFTGCHSHNNSVAGLRRTGAAALSSTIVSGFNASSNGGGNLVGSLAGAIGYDQGGLASPGTNRF